MAVVDTPLQPDRAPQLRVIIAGALVVLLLKVLFSILWEYRFYFPANFDSAFLGGRRYTFVGTYRAAFYVHIISGPVAILAGGFLIATSNFPRLRSAHRYIGRLQGMLVIGVLAPSGLVMAANAYAGPVAAWGFALLSLGTALACVQAIRYAVMMRMEHHRRWAIRCFILLCSPLLLRLMSGAVIVLGVESDLTYRLNAWMSWLIPLAIYELSNRFAEANRFSE
jgi:hypothetical protein